MNASFGANRQRRKSRLVADLIGDELVKGDVAVASVLRFVVEHAREKGVHGEMPSPQSVDSGKFPPIYKFGEGIVTGEDITISASEICIPGFGHSVNLDLDNPYSDMDPIEDQ